MSTVESLLLGLVLIEPQNFDKAATCGVTYLSFADPNLGEIWKAAEAVAKSDLPFDPATIVSKLKGDPAARIGSLLADAPVGMNVEYFAHEVVEAAWAQRTALDLSAMAGRLQNREPFDAERKTQALALLKRLTETYVASVVTPEPPVLVDDFFRELEQALADRAKGIKPGITTGLSELDSLTFGWRPSTLNVIGARTSCGKTTLAVNFAAAAALAGKQVAYFTVEMRAARIAGKITSLISGVNGGKIANADLNDHEVQRVYEAGQKLAGLGLRVNDKAGRTIETVESEAWRLHRQGKLDMLVVDYVQQLYWPSRRWHSRQAELTAITASLQELAKRFNIPVLILAQLSRQAESLPPDQPPGKHHLKDSGSLEQDADVVVLVHRPQPKDPRGITHLIVDKCREGATGAFEVDCDMRVNRFADWRTL